MESLETEIQYSIDEIVEKVVRVTKTKKLDQRCWSYEEKQHLRNRRPKLRKNSKHCSRLDKKQQAVRSRVTLIADQWTA